jgi:Na+-driven multidrug efflux pump
MYFVVMLFQAIASLAYLCLFKPGQATRAFPGRAGLVEALGSRSELVIFARLAVPGVFAMTEWWFWEVTCLQAGAFGAESLAAHSIVYLMVPLLFQVPRGIRDGVCTRAGIMLGGGRARAARNLTLGGVLVGCFLVCFDAGIAHVFHREWIDLLAGSSKEVRRLCDDIWPYVTFFLVLDGWFPLNQGVCNIHGLQSRVSYSMIVSLWLVGVPVILMVTTDLVTLWQTFPHCYVALNLLLLLSYVFQDWELAAQQASLQARSSATSGTPASCRGEESKVLPVIVNVADEDQEQVERWK